MNRTTRSPWQPLLLPVVAALEAGGQISAEVIDYIASALFDPDADRLAAFLSDDSDSERDSLLDLIFYPDQALQLTLEPLLAAAGCAADDETALGERLMNTTIDALVRLPDGRPLVSVRLPDFIKSQFLARLNITWQLNPDVAAAIAAGVPQVLQLPVTVRLRNAAFDFADNHCRFLNRLFTRLTDRGPGVMDCLDVVLPLLTADSTDSHGYDLLAERKRSLFRSFQQARRFEKLLRRSNMETLMLQGIRPPAASADDLQGQMRLIDRICLQTYGRTETIITPMEQPLRQVSDLQTPESVIKSLL
jgi:hypothetical protein